MLARGNDDTPIVKVLDFGVAKVLEPVPDVNMQLTQQGVFVGTPRYAAPEQLVHEPVDGRTDIYGVGMVMWEALVGDPAVPELDYGACVEYHLGPDPWILPDWISCPQELADIVHRSLQKRASDRYDDVSALAADLERFVHLNAGQLDDALQSLMVAAEPSEPSIDLPGDAIFSGIGQQISESEPNDDGPPLLAPTRREVATKRLELDGELQPEKPKTFAQMDGDAIEVAKPAPTRRPAERKPETYEIEKRVQKQRTMPNWLIVVIGCAILAAIVVAVSFSKRDAETVEPPKTTEPAKTLTLKDDFLLNAMRATGWEIRVGDTLSYFDGIQQTSVSAKRKTDRAHLTIFECESLEKTEYLKRERTGDEMDIEFGTTLVRVADTTPGGTKAFITLKTLQEVSNEEKNKP